MAQGTPKRPSLIGWGAWCRGFTVPSGTESSRWTGGGRWRRALSPQQRAALAWGRASGRAYTGGGGAGPVLLAGATATATAVTSGTAASAHAGAPAGSSAPAAASPATAAAAAFEYFARRFIARASLD